MDKDRNHFEDKYPATCRFFREDVYSDYEQPSFFIRYVGRKEEIVIRFFRDGKVRDEYTPVDEINGWLMPCGGEFELYYSEAVLSTYYKSLTHA